MSFGRAALLSSAAFFVFSALPPTVSSRDASPPSPVTVVFYNLKNYLAMERRVDGEILEDAPKPEVEVKALISGISEIEPAILGICEIGDAAYLADFQSRLVDSGIDLPHTELVTAASGHNRNLGLLSRFPIVARHSRDDLSYSIADARLPFQRGVLDVTIAINPSYHLRYVALHLKSKREVAEANQALMRLNEARLARDHIDRIFEREPGVNLLVAGDFNDLRIEPPVKTLQGGFGRQDYLSSLTLEDRHGFRWTHYWSFADSYSRFDFALYSKGLSPEIDRSASHIYHWDEWNTASDHRPLVISIVPEDR